MHESTCLLKSLNHFKAENVINDYRFNLLGSGDENDSEEEGSFANSKKSMKSDEVKSSLELRQERLSKVIGRLEDEALSEKPWQLKGEVSANLRPENSLLEEAVDFDLSVRPGTV